MFLRLTPVSQMDPGSRDLDFAILIYPSPTYLGGKSYLVAMGVYQGIVSHTPDARADSWSRASNRSGLTSCRTRARVLVAFLEGAPSPGQISWYKNRTDDVLATFPFQLVEEKERL